MNGFNKTEAAVFSCRLCFLRAFPVISLIQNARCTQKMSVDRVNRNNTILHRTFYTITASEHILKAFYKCTYALDTAEFAFLPQCTVPQNFKLRPMQ